MISSLLQAIPAVITAFKGRDTKGERQAAAQSQSLARAQYDMSSPEFQKLYTQGRQLGQQNLAETVAEVSRQNRKLNLLGRNPLLSQERGGENLFRSLIGSQLDVEQGARDTAFNQLNRGLTGQQMIFKNQGVLADQDFNNKMLRLRGYYTLGDALGEILGNRGVRRG